MLSWLFFFFPSEQIPLDIAQILEFYIFFFQQHPITLAVIIHILTELFLLRLRQKLKSCLNTLQYLHLPLHLCLKITHFYYQKYVQTQLSWHGSAVKAVKVEALSISKWQYKLLTYKFFYFPMNEYEFLKELGSGSFGRVVKVRKNKSDKEVYAMKQIKMMQLNARQKDNALNEVRLLASIDSPNIISYKSAFFEEFGSTLCILMEYADGGDLAGLIKKKIEKHQRFNENFIWQVAYDILMGLKILHSNHIIHRDIKPANVFFVGGTAKIGDLNVSKVTEGKYASTQTGTPYYTSPEIWNNVKYDGRVDIWSLGCLLFELAALRPPFIAKDFPGLSRKVVLGYYDPIPSTYSKRLAEVIKRCLTVKMNDRPSAKELLKQQIFHSMENPVQGEIELLDTIRCPKMLKNLHHELPQSKSVKRLITLKEIEKEEEAPRENYPKSMKRIGSSKNIPLGMPPTPIRYHKDQKENEKIVENFKSPIQSPNGYVKLPRIASHKNILF